ncbi:protein D3-like [Maniola hyperantus]|uniref:protein D3-like n=1 Tax=Aphantopus hyperantus TaxID=2795564 RepID=UPI001568F18B|nr:protein D3-like [Maniola hyperantus]
MGDLWKISIVLLLQHSIVTEIVFAEGGCSVELAFLTNEIVTDVIPYAPNYKLSVIYPSGAEVELGNELTPTEVKDIPSVWWPGEFTHCNYYTLALVDPDATSRKTPIFRNWEHWLVGNIPGNHVVSGETIAEYVGAAPGLGSGCHRYVYLLYKQPERIVFDEPRLNNRSAANRTLFSITDFANKYNLGNPVAGNFFMAQYDDYVPILQKQLSN